MRTLVLTGWLALAGATGCSSASPDGSTSPSDAMADAKPVGRTDGGHDAAAVHAADGSASADGAGAGGLEGQDDGGVVGPLTIHVNASLPASQRMLVEAEAIVAGMKQTTYDHTTLIDESTGTYDVDCSGFTNFVIQQAVPPAFTELAQATSPRPYAAECARFFVALPTAGSGSWHPVTIAMNLVPGDVVAWVEPPTLNSTDTGHTAVVALAPVAGKNEVDVKIIDSTLTPHGATDPRAIDGTTGVGEGTMAITVDGTGAATGYRWADEPGVLAYTTTVGMAHLE